MDKTEITKRVFGELSLQGLTEKEFVIAMRESIGVRDPEKDWTQHRTHWLNRGLPDKYHLAASEFLWVNQLWLTTGSGQKYKNGVLPERLSARTGGQQTNVLTHEKSGIIHSLPDPVPLISSVQAGAWGEAIDIYQPGIGEKMIPTAKPHSPSAFALRVEGDSMTSPYGRSFWDGMYIIVDPEQAAYNGDLVVAKIKGDDKVTFKKLVIESGKTFLVPLNPQHPPIHDEFRILGKVIQGTFDT